MTTHHQNILNNLVSGIIVINAEDEIIVFNRAAEQILKSKSAEILGKPVRALSNSLAGPLLDTLHSGKSYHRKRLYVLPEKTLIGLSTSRIYDLDSKLSGAAMVFNSLSRASKQEEMPQQENAAYWRSIANAMAHGIKNSLVATKVLMEMFPEKHQDSEYRKQLYSAINRDVQKLDEFSEGLLSFAQNKQLTMQICRIDEVANAALADVFNHLPDKEITVEKRYAQVPALMGDYQQLKEAFYVIIENAIEAIVKKGKLYISIEIAEVPVRAFSAVPDSGRLPGQFPPGRVSARQAASSIIIRIADTGRGIPPENLPDLFNPFFTTKEGKSGLGLCIAQKIIERHRGHIRIESKTGEGTVVMIYLPVLSG